MTRVELSTLQEKLDNLNKTINKAKDIVRKIDVVESTLKCINSVNVPYGITVYNSRNNSFDLPFDTAEMEELWGVLNKDLIKRLEDKKEGLERQFAEIKVRRD